MNAKSQIERNENKKNYPTYHLPYWRYKPMAYVFLQQ